MYFRWSELKHAIPAKWKKQFFDYNHINNNDLYQNHQIVKGTGVLLLDKLSP